MGAFSWQPEHSWNGPTPITPLQSVLMTYGLSQHPVSSCLSDPSPGGLGTTSYFSPTSLTNCVQIQCHVCELEARWRGEWGGGQTYPMCLVFSARKLGGEKSLWCVVSANILAQRPVALCGWGCVFNHVSYRFCSYPWPFTLSAVLSVSGTRE